MGANSNVLLLPGLWLSKPTARSKLLTLKDAQDEPANLGWRRQLVAGPKFGALVPANKTMRPCHFLLRPEEIHAV